MTVIQKGKIALQETNSKVSLKTLAQPLAQYCVLVVKSHWGIKRKPAFVLLVCSRE